MLQALSNFQQRFFLGLIGTVFIVLSIALSHRFPYQYFFVALLAIIQAQALSEYYRLCRLKNLLPLSKLGIGFSLLFITARYFLYMASTVTLLPLLLIALVFLAFILHFAKVEQAIVDLATTCFGLLYITLPLSLCLDINFQGHAGRYASLWLFYLIVTTKMTDTAAYAAGKLWGIKKFIPHISPNKTIAGAMGGLLGALLTSFLFYKIATFFGYRLPLSELELLLLGGALGVVAQIGDLAESLIKRDAQVKDSSHLPGFGGILDVVDSLIFTTPTLYFYLRAKNIL
jgi:phosphatidate cytidylyltransferase